MKPGDELFHQTRFERLQAFMYSDVEVLELTSRYIRDTLRVATVTRLQVIADALSHVRKRLVDQNIAKYVWQSAGLDRERIANVK